MAQEKKVVWRVVVPVALLISIIFTGLLVPGDNITVQIIKFLLIFTAIMGIAVLDYYFYKKRTPIKKRRFAEALLLLVYVSLIIGSLMVAKEGALGFLKGFASSFVGFGLLFLVIYFVVFLLTKIKKLLNGGKDER